MAVYHAFPFGKLNQSIKMENENNQAVYEATMVKFKLFTAEDFEFTNHILSTTKVHKIGKTVTTENAISFTSASYFKMDGKNVFEVLKEMGYSFKILVKMDILHPEFALLDKSGNNVATYKMNVKGEREADVMGIGNKQSNIVITTDSDDIDAVFLGAFILSKVDFSLYLSIGGI